MGNNEIKSSDVPSSYYSLYNNNYLPNSYKYIIRSKTVHFIAILIETLFNIFQELYIFVKEYNPEKDEKLYYYYFLTFIPDHLHNIPLIFNILIVLIYIVVFEVIYYFLGKFECKKEEIHIFILYNTIELLYFRISMIVFLNIFCCLSYTYFFILLLLLIPHLYITSYHFLYNHLYIFVPKFIEYPFDELSSLFDIFSLVIKILLSINANVKNVHVSKCIYIITFIFQIYCCIYFIYQLINHSYLFMKNLFLNETKISLLFVQTLTLIIAELIGKEGILNISFPIIFISLCVFILLFIYINYDPKLFVRIKRETPEQNLYFYLFVLSHENQPCYLIETKIKNHYERCGICILCKKYNKYFNHISNILDIEENGNLNMINKEEYETKNCLINIFFNIISEGNNKYFSLIKEMILTYKNKAESLLVNCSYFYINLSFLLFSELKNNNYVLALNIKIILDVINNENKLLDIHESQIKQITLCNEFLTLVNSTLEQIKNILKTDDSKASKLINLSSSLKEMKDTKYREAIFNHKHDNISNSRNIIYLCSLLYEEIFNVVLNNNQVPLRENYQMLEDNFINIDKVEKIITLALNLTNKNCKIVRAGRDLYNYKDKNLFDLIPLIFKDYIQKNFITKILEYFNSNKIRDSKERSKGPNNNLINSNNKYENKITKRVTMKKDASQKIMIKNEYMEFYMIISENISSKIFYRLLILRLTPLFNYDYNCLYILLDGSFRLFKNTIMTLQDAKNQTETGQKIISVSKPELESPPEIYKMKFHKYMIYLETNNLKLSKILDFILSKKLFSIYTIIQKDKDAYYKSLKRISFFSNKTIKLEFNINKEKITSKNKIEYFVEDNGSVKSQLTSLNNPNYTSGFNMKTKKRENIYRNSNLFKIENIIYLMIPIIILFTIVEIIHLLHLKKGDYNNDYSLLCFNEFYKLYFQLFSTILSVVCIKNESGCENIMSLYSKRMIGIDYYFNTSQYMYGQCQFFFKTLLEKKNNLLIIHQNIGKNKYERIFEQKVNYTRISKNYNKDSHKIDLNLMNTNIIFTDAILISINSFQILTNNTLNEQIYLLHKRNEPFFYFDNYGRNAKNLTDFQKELYEMILNYKIYWTEYRVIYYKLLEALQNQTKNIKLYIFLYFNISYTIIVIIIVMLYIYMNFFEVLIVKLLNYVNMIINNKEDKFNFFKEFTKKIENLDIILKIYDDNPVKAVHNIISSYNKYDKYILNKKKNMYLDTNKKQHKKSENKEGDDIFSDVPKHLRIINKNDINKLYIMFYYYSLTLVIFVFIIISYIILYFMWEKYYLIKDNLYSLLKKDTELEISFFKAMNTYNLMIFNNSTLDDLAQDVFYESTYKIKNGQELINSFYDELFLAFNFEIEIKILVKTFSGFPFFNFTCENLYNLEKDNIGNLQLNPEIQKIGNAGEKMYTLCKRSGIDTYNDISVVYESHYQKVIYSIISIVDFSYDGLLNHLKEGLFGEIYLNFCLILMYITDIINVKLHKEEYDNLLGVLSQCLTINILVVILFYIILMVIVIFFYIRKLKKFCAQIILLKQVFQICEVHEQ